MSKSTLEPSLATPSRTGAHGEEVLAGTDLFVRYRSHRSLGDTARRRALEPIRALDGISLELRRGEMLAVVGESGSGKTTAGHALMRLSDHRRADTDGTVRFEGHDVTKAGGGDLQKLRRHVQLVFQDPYESLDPRFTVRDTVTEPLRVHGVATKRRELRDRAAAILEKVGLDPETYLDRYPHELSGGQRQRVAIAAALILEPTVLIADEPVSMLDMSVRADVLALLSGLASEGLAIMMITHDLSTAAHYADRIAVMYLGRIVEEGHARAVINHPQHPYTKALLTVVPRRGSEGVEPTILQGEIPDASAVPTGCRFHPRCPVALASCSRDDPSLSGDPAHRAACVLVTPTGESK